MQVAKYSSGRQINRSQNEISPSWGGGGVGLEITENLKYTFAIFSPKVKLVEK